MSNFKKFSLFFNRLDTFFQFFFWTAKENPQVLITSNYCILSLHLFSKEDPVLFCPQHAFYFDIFSFTFTLWSPHGGDLLVLVHLVNLGRIFGAHKMPFHLKKRAGKAGKQMLIDDIDNYDENTLSVGVSSPPARLKSVGKRRNFLTWAALLTTLQIGECCSHSH